MSSNNNPETPVMPVSTTVVINGQQFDLTRCDAAMGAQIRAALPVEYQTKIDAMAKFVENCQGPLADKLPPELQEPGKLEELIEACKQGAAQGGSALSNFVPQPMKDMLTKVATNMPGYEGVAAILKACGYAVSGTQMVYNGVNETKDWLMMPGRALAAIFTAGHEALSANGRKPTHEQAIALCATYEACIYMQVDSPLAPAATRRRASTGLQYVLDLGIAGFEWAGDRIGSVFGSLGSSGIGKWFRTLFSAIGDWISNKGWDWERASKAVDAADAARPAAAAHKVRSFDEIYQENLLEKTQEKSRPQAKAILDQLGDVAGLNVSRLTRLIDKGGYYVGYDKDPSGSYYIYRTDPGLESVKQVLGPNNTPLTSKQLYAARADDITGTIGQHGLISAGVTGLTAAMVGRGALERGTGRFLSGPVDRAVRAEADAARTYNSLEARIVAAQAGQRRFFWSRGPEDVGALRTQLTAAQTDLESATGRLTRMGVDTSKVEGLTGSARTTALRLQSIEGLRGDSNVLLRGVGSLAASSTEKLNGWNPLNWPRMLGRGAGHVTGAVADHATRPFAAIGEKFSGWFGGGHAAAATAATDTTAVAASTASTVSNTAETVATTAAKGTGVLSRIGTWGSKLAGIGGGRWGAPLRLLGLGVVGAASIAGFVAPAEAVSKTVAASAAGNAAEAGVRGVESATLVGTATVLGRTAPIAAEAGAFSKILTVGKFGLGRIAPAVAPIVSGADFVSSAVQHDSRGMVTSGTTLGTIAAGAAIGLAGGPFAPVTVPMGMLGGAIVGLFTGWGAGRIYDHYNPPAAPAQAAAAPTPQPAGALGQPDPGIQVALTDPARRQAMAVRNHTVKIGGKVVTDENGQLQPQTFTGGDNAALVIS